MQDKRVTVRKAAILLGVSEGAVRKLVARDTLKHEKGTDGRVYVYLPAEVDPSTPRESDPLISEMRSRIGFLEEEPRRKDAILMNMTEAMKALRPPSEPRNASEAATQGPEEKELPKTKGGVHGGGGSPGNDRVR